VVKESIGKNNLSPSLTFDTAGLITIPVLTRDTHFQPPKINLNPDFNPFENEPVTQQREGNHYQRNRMEDWEKLFAGTEKSASEVNIHSGSNNNTHLFQESGRFMQLKGHYILTPVKSGLMVIDQKRAHERVIYERTLREQKSARFAAQKLLFPETIELNTSDFVTFVEIKETILQLGFDISEFGKNSVIVNGIPETVKRSDIKSLVEEILEEYKSLGTGSNLKMLEKLANSIATASAIPYGKILEIKEMQDLVDQLFACSDPNHSPSGKPVISIIQTEVIEKSLKG
ncbi:MAG: hypothetical protein IH594_03450, partial [Bacteroidales bacterium]|nr:hypothetical protein [Bacteroidales bacterium]